MAEQPDPEARVDLLEVVEVLHEHLTPALVDNAYEALRGTERERAWTLRHLVQFWTAVILRAPRSLLQALRDMAGGVGSGYPQVEASPQAFFQRCQDLHWEFFAAVFRAFVRSLSEREPPRFARQHAALASRFPRILILDGSALDPVARRLKVTQGHPAVPIPGMVLACYDLLRGTLADLLFSSTLRRGELAMAREAMAKLKADTLLVADRLYGTPKLLAEATQKGLWAVFRYQPGAQFKDMQLLGKTSVQDGELEDWSLALGARAGVAARLIRLRRGAKEYLFITNVLDPQALSAREVADLYRDRWQVERLFQDLKEVLNLKRFYCANSNAVAMQVFACAIVHTAMRVAQGRIAHAAAVEPEDLSEAKLFPLLAAVSATLTTLEAGFFATELANPGYRLAKPDWRTVCATEIPLKKILADKTRGRRPRPGAPPIRPGANRWQELPPPRPRRPRGPQS